MTSTILRRTPDLHRMLQSVADGHVVHHSGTCGAWPTGWSWSEGGHMDDATQHEVGVLWGNGLIVFDVPAKSCGNLAKLTFDGSQQLPTWNLAWPKDGAA